MKFALPGLLPAGDCRDLQVLETTVSALEGPAARLVLWIVSNPGGRHPQTMLGGTGKL